MLFIKADFVNASGFHSRKKISFHLIVFWQLDISVYNHYTCVYLPSIYGIWDLRWMTIIL